MSERILGKDLSTYKAIAISLGQSKNENNDGVKSRFVALTLKDKFSIGARKVSHILFEDEIGTEAFEELMQCRAIGADNKPILDQHQGYVVSAKLVKERSVERKKEDVDNEDPLMLDTLLTWEGGMTQIYKFPNGPRYGNNADGQATKDKDGNQIVKDSIEVFVQVKDVVIKEDGTRDYTYVSGMNPNTRGERLMRTFFKTPVANTTAEAPIEEAAEAGPGF
jgi:hypothetical protein